VYKEPFPCIEFAVKRERQIKKWSRGKKEALIRGDLKALKNLSKHRNR
jgi:putative endonuclease